MFSGKVLKCFVKNNTIDLPRCNGTWLLTTKKLVSATKETHTSENHIWAPCKFLDPKTMAKWCCFITFMGDWVCFSQLVLLCGYVSKFFIITMHKQQQLFIKGSDSEWQGVSMWDMNGYQSSSNLNRSKDVSYVMLQKSRKWLRN
jgi:hypothetical protein